MKKDSEDFAYINELFMTRTVLQRLFMNRRKFSLSDVLVPQMKSWYDKKQ